MVIPTPDEPFQPDDTPFYAPGKKYQVLYLLHGAHGDCTVWTRNTGIERYAQEYKLAVVSASVTNSCYLDMAHGGRFFRSRAGFRRRIFGFEARRGQTRLR